MDDSSHVSTAGPREGVRHGCDRGRRVAVGTGRVESRGAIGTGGGLPVPAPDRAELRRARSWATSLSWHPPACWLCYPCASLICHPCSRSGPHFPLDNFRERVRARPQTSSRACASSPAARQETRIRLRRLESHPAPWRPARSIPGPRKVAAYIVGMEPTRSLEQLTDGELLLRLADILRQSRRNEADLVAHIGEVDARRLYAREASPSMYAYCTERLHLSEAEAYLRIAAARASRQHPILLAMLADGRLHLTAIAKLAPHLTPDNRDAVLERATHCSKRQVEELAAELAPRPDAPALIRKLPEPSPIAPSPTSGRPRADRIAGSSSNSVQTQLPRSSRGATPLPRPSRAWVGTKRRRPAPSSVRTESARSVSHPRRLPRRASSRSPPGATASSSPPAPGCATSSRGSRPSCAPPSPAPTSPPSSKTPSPRSSKGSRPAASVSRRPPARTSRRPRRSPPRATSLPPSAGPCTSGTGAVVASSTNRADGARPATSSNTTTATPLAMGGDHSPQGIALACKAHNLYLAEVDYGRAAMARHRRSSTNQSSAKRSSTGPPGPGRQAETRRREP